MPKFINPANLPEPYVKAVMADDYDAGESDYTPSSLGKPPYMAALEKEFGEIVEVDVASRFFALMGKMAHKLLEEHDDGKNSRTEIRVYNQIDKWVIGMQFDRLNLDRDPDNKKITLQDWKMTSVWKFKKDYKGNYSPAPEWEAQLNIGAYLLRQGGYYNDKDGVQKKFDPLPVTDLEVIGLLRDFHQTEAERDQFYPQQPVVSRKLRMWSDSEVLTYIYERANSHDKAKNLNINLIPPCTDEETWAKPSSWAIMKKGLKRAKKLCTVEEEATKLIDTKYKDEKGMYIEKRPGSRTRCEKYCDIAPFCPAFETWAKINNPEALKKKRALKEKFLGNA